ncbi:SDR family oxidoreductase [Pseudenhygromyxa sp. WMMC2535]|uniref:SDR family NAD(P)-dependent oxidoreductase n=1 Tax=Pseudenhygromyxa sp. WMMC2535 TaxID=2712867 RepID=UPI0015580BF8|nr:SDR family oxidoreductase [Pseudenhygromyxa sp. WMMC2535]
MEDQRERQPVAVITGASAGLGRELARLFAADGHGLVLVARREARLRELADELEAAHSITALPLAMDLSDPEAPDAIAAALAGEGLDPEFLVNNAGFGTSGAFAELALARELEEISVNIRALVHLTRLLLPGMVERGRGRILNLGSTAGFQPGPYMATYYASKAFVNHFSEALAHELAGTGVSVTVSCPGPTATEFGAVAGNAKSALFERGVVASSEDVARHAYQAMLRGERMAVPGLINKLLVRSGGLLPRGLLLRITGRLNQP